MLHVFIRELAVAEGAVDIVDQFHNAFPGYPVIVRVAVEGFVGRADQRVIAPGNQEEMAAGRRHGTDDVLAGKKTFCGDDVNSFRPAQHRRVFSIRFGHIQKKIRPRSAAVHCNGSRNVMDFAGQQVFDLHPGNPVSGIHEETFHFGIIRRFRAVGHGGFDKGQRQAFGKNAHAVAEDRCAGQSFGSNMRLLPQDLSAGNRFVRRNSFAGIPGAIFIIGQGVVKQHAHFHNPFIVLQRLFMMHHHDRLRIDVIGSDIFQHSSLAQRFPHQPHFSIDQIPKTAVNHFGRGRRSRPGKILFFQQRHLQSPGGGFIGNRRPADPPADDDHVKFFMRILFYKPFHARRSF